MNAFSNRMSLTAEMVIPAKPAADIGADHAQLAIHLVETGLVPRVIVGELGDGPFGRAGTAVKQCCCPEKIELRQGNGLDVLGWHEVSTVFLAGMGGDTIVEILSRSWDKAASFERFVLQPMSKAHVLRQRLASRGWIIESEALAEEGNRLFLVLTVRPGNLPYFLTDLELDIGPVLLKNKSRLTKLHMERILRRYRLIYKEITGAADKGQRTQGDYYGDKISGLEELLNEY